jgi:hypothetical protein
MQIKAVYLLSCKFTLHVLGVDPSSGLHKTVTTASGIGHIFCAATPSVAKLGHVVVKVLCTPDDGCG